VVPGTSFLVLLAYVLAALLGIFLIGHAAIGSWRLALVAFGTLPVAMGGALLVVYAAHWTGSLGAVAGLLAVFGLAARQAVTVIGRIREGHQDISAAAASAAGHAVTLAVVTAAALAPFAVFGDKAGLELLWPAACVILGGLVTITLVSLIALPVECLALGPERIAPSSESDPDEVLVPPQREPAEADPPAADSAEPSAVPAEEPAEAPAAEPVALADPADAPVTHVGDESPVDPAAEPAGQGASGASGV
jgi:hypothetical protein